MCAPYASVIDIDEARLPQPNEVRAWSSEQCVPAQRPDLSCETSNPHLRQRFHVSYKIATRMGDQFLEMLVTNRESVSRNVTLNLLERHMKPLFLAN